MNRTACICIITTGLGAALLSVLSAAQPHAAQPADLPEGWYAGIETSLGAFVVRLLPEQSPESVAHFAALAEGRLDWTNPITGEPVSGRYYDGAPINRAEGAAMIQVGEQSAQGTFAPFLYVPEKPTQDVNFHMGWRLANVRVGPKVSAARWLVTVGAMPELNGTVPCFGAVVEGQETVFELTAVKTHPNGRPIDPLVVKSVRIFSVGQPAALPEPVPYLPESSPLRMLDFKDDGLRLKDGTR